MVRVDKIYESDLVSVLLISSKYDINYIEKDYNSLPAISFPVKAGYRYKSGKFDRIVDTNAVLFEKGNIKFEITKYSQFTHDITLTFQFSESSFELIDRIIKPKQTAETFNRTPQIENLVQLFLLTYSNSSILLKDQLIDDLLFENILRQKLQVLKIYSVKPWLNIKIDAAKDYIYSQSSEDISLTDISAASNISLFHFSRVFKQKTGYSPYEYLLKIRVVKAQQLLRNNTSVTSTAFDVGFNSIENFSYGFKKIVGISPSQYKKSKISKTF